MTGWVEFVSGSATGLVGRRFLGVVDAPPSSPLVSGLSQLLDRGNLASLLEQLADHRVRDLPPFTLVGRTSTQAFVVQRGQVQVWLDGSRDGIPLEAGSATSWVEHRVELERCPMLLVPSASGESGGASGFVTLMGIVPVSQIIADVEALEESPEIGDGGAVPPTSISAALAADIVPGEPSAPEESQVPPPAASETLPEPVTMQGYASGESHPGVVLSDQDVVDSSIVAEEDRPGPGPASVGESQPQEYDYLFGATRHQSIENAAVARSGADGSNESVDRDGAVIEAVPSGPGSATGPGSPSGPGAAPHSASADALGDHDGHTTNLAALREQAESAADISGETVSGFAGSMVPAITCSEGHANAPYAHACRVCAEEFATATPKMVARPPLGVLMLPDGSSVPVDRTIIIGRAPKACGGFQGEPPRLVSVDGGEGDVSRTHVEIRVEDWQVMVVDLGSTNGTVVVLPGRKPERIHAGDPVVIVGGTGVVLADDVTLRFEVE